MPSKAELLSLVDYEFLDSFVLSYNNKPRYHSFGSKESLVAFCSKKFNEGQVAEIFDSFKLGMSPILAANGMKELSGRELGAMFIEKFKPKDYMFEVSLGSNICDLVLLDRKRNLVAIEIKANGDDLSRAPEQCRAYTKWADYVYIMVDEKKVQAAKSMLPRWVGLISFIGARNRLYMNAPQERARPDISFILENISKEKLEALARMYKVKVSGNKADLIFRLKPLLENKRFTVDLKASLIR